MIDNQNKHNEFLDKFDILYSTSANKTNEQFSKEYAISNSDIIVYSKDDFYEKIASSIYKVSKNKIIKIR